MSGSLNKVFLCGNLTKDPEQRSTADGTAVVNFSVAVNRSYKSGNEFKKEVMFFNVVVWGKSGENCAKYLSKGRSVLVEGRLQNQQWEKDGVKQYKTQVVANNVQFLGSGKPEAGGEAGSEDTGSDGNYDAGADDSEAVPF